jgi:hypothetical protein
MVKNMHKTEIYLSEIWMLLGSARDFEKQVIEFVIARSKNITSTFTILFRVHSIDCCARNLLSD